MTRIALKKEYLMPVLSRKKISTIRWGRREYALGDTDNWLVCGESEIAINITKLCFTTVACLTDEDAINDGFDCLQELFDALFAIYPQMLFDDDVTIVYFDLLHIGEKND